jgi:hypothetical protein
MKQKNKKNEVRKGIPGRRHLVFYDKLFIPDNTEKDVKKQKKDGRNNLRRFIEQCHPCDRNVIAGGIDIKH